MGNTLIVLAEGNGAYEVDYIIHGVNHSYKVTAVRKCGMNEVTARECLMAGTTKVELETYLGVHQGKGKWNSPVLVVTVEELEINPQDVEDLDVTVELGREEVQELGREKYVGEMFGFVSGELPEGMKWDDVEPISKEELEELFKEVPCDSHRTKGINSYQIMYDEDMEINTDEDEEEEQS